MVKAEAIGIKGSNQVAKIVAVKMVRSKTNVAALEALVSELKILIYLGSHLNVVNLLGACTKQITKGMSRQNANNGIGFENSEEMCDFLGELYIIVEYCRFGNLQTYLTNHRKNFINLLDDLGNIKPKVQKDQVNEIIR